MSMSECIVCGMCNYVCDACIEFSQPKAGFLCRALGDGALTLPESSTTLSP